MAKNGRRDKPLEPPVSHYKPPLPKDANKIVFFCREEELAAWMKAAGCTGLDPWIRRVLNAEVSNV